MPEGTRARNAIASLVAARIVYAVNWLNIGAIFVFMESTLNVGIIGLGTLTSTFYLGLGLTQLPAGIMSATFGPRRSVIAGVIVSSAATLAIPWSTQLLEVAALRFLVGAGMAMVFAPSVVLVATYFGGSRSGLGVGVYNSAFDVGGVLGLYVWIVIASAAGWQQSLLLSGGLGVATALLVYRMVPRDGDASRLRVGRPALVRILKDRQLVLLGLGTLGLTAGNTLVSNFMVYYLSQALGVSRPLAGLVTSMIVVLPIFTSLWAGRVYDRLRKPRMMMLLSGGGMGGALVVAAYPSPVAAALGAVLAGVVSGVGFTVTFAWARSLNTSEPQYDGLAISWVNGISLTGAFVPPLVFAGAVGMWGYPAAWLAGAGMCVVLTAAMLFQREGIPVRAG